MEQGKTISLHPEEKDTIRRRLHSYVAQHPVKGELSHTWLSTLLLRPLPAFLAVALLVGSGVAYGAKGALPGDPLYPMKVNVSEPFQGMFYVSQEAKLTWETSLAATRLKEAEQLAMQGRLDASTQVQITSRVEAHTHRITTKVKELQEKNDIDARIAANVSAELESSLQAHQQVLNELTLSVNVQEPVRKLYGSVQIQAQEVAKIRKESEQNAAAKDMQLKKSAQTQLRATQQVIVRLRQAITRANNKANTSLLPQANTQLRAAESLMVEAKLQNKKEEYVQAIAKLQEASRIAQEARVLIEAQVSLRVTLPKGVTEVQGNQSSTGQVSGGLNIQIGL